MKKEDFIEQLLLDKEYDQLNTKERAMLEDIGWDKADYQQERGLRLQLKDWANLSAPHNLPEQKTWPAAQRPGRIRPAYRWAMAACWLLSLGLAAFLGFHSATTSPLQIVEKGVFQTDTVYLPAPIPVLASLDTIRDEVPPAPSTARAKSLPSSPKVVVTIDPKVDQPDAFSSRSMAADSDLMKLTTRVW